MSAVAPLPESIVEIARAYRSAVKQAAEALDGGNIKTHRWWMETAELHAHHLAQKCVELIEQRSGS